MEILNHKDVLQNLTPTQIDVIVSNAQVKVLLQGRQSGKTTTLRAVLYKEALENPGIEILFCACTFKQVKENAFRILISGNDPIFPKELVKKINNTDLTVELINGTRITFAGTENIDALLGRTLDLLILDEYQSMHKEVLMKLQPMIAARRGRIVIAGTVRGFNHMYDAYWAGSKDNPNRNKGWRSWRIPTANSGTPAGTKESIEMAKAALSRQQYAQEYECSPTSLKGVVYGMYDIDKNDTNFEIDPSKALLVGLDFNVGAMVAVIAQKHVVTINRNGRSVDVQQLHVIEEIALENVTTQAMATAIVNKYGTTFKGRIIVYPDPSGNSRKTSANINSTDHTILRNAGFQLHFHNKHPEIVDRVNAVNALFCNANDERRLYIARKCKNLVRALVGQVYDSSGKPMKGTGGVDDLSGPVDSLGYLVEYLFPIGGATSSQSNAFGHK